MSQYDTIKLGEFGGKMKVSNVGINGINNSLNKVDSSKTEKTASDQVTDRVSIGGKSAGVKGTDQLNLSEHAQRMSRAKEIASEDSIDEAKVARLQKMIDEGSYKVNAEAIADRIVDEHIKMS